MNPAEWSVRHPLPAWSAAVLMFAGGIAACFQLPRFEDPEFTIKQAQVITRYPGASPEEVSREVTDCVENAIQEMGQLKQLDSRSLRGLSIVTAEMRNTCRKQDLPQIWDELRNKIDTAARSRPQGAQVPEVVDDYGDVYGAFFAVTGQGADSVRLHEFARSLQKKLLRAEDVKRVTLFAVPPEAVYVSLDRTRLGRLGIAPQTIFDLLRARNPVTDEGWLRTGNEWLPIRLDAGINTLDSLRQMVISSRNGKIITLGDIAEVRSGLLDPPEKMLYFNGLRAIGLGVSTRSGGNVVHTGDSLKRLLDRLSPEFPAEIKVETISSQAETVRQAITSFAVNLLESVLIVIGVLLLFMGLKSGLIIGFVLLLTIAGTLMLMNYYGIPLQRISLGALIIALGMLVDNAIVITEGMMVRIRAGQDKLEAAREVTAQTQLPLLGATAIAITAFAAIGLSDDSTGEFCGSLFQVLLISLSLSWLTAVTVTPLLCCYAFRPGPDPETDPYRSGFFLIYKSWLDWTLRHRIVSITLLIVLFIAGLMMFSRVGRNFFPDSTRAQFLVDIRLPYGTSIYETDRAAAEVESYVRTLPGVGDITRCVGGGALRFILTYAPEEPDTGYAQLLVNVRDYRKIPALIGRIYEHAREKFPHYGVIPYRFRLGPGAAGSIQARFLGGTRDELRQLGEETMRIMRANPNARAIYTDWRNRIKVITPVFSEERAGRAGITRQQASDAIRESFEGLPVGSFRDGEQLIPIYARAPRSLPDRDFGEGIQVWSPAANRMVPLSQFFDATLIEWIDPVIVHRDRVEALTVKCDPVHGLSSTLLQELRPKIEKLKRPPGCTLEWGGEYENSTDASNALYVRIPPFALLMVLIVLFLFNSVRKTLVVWLCVPLTVTGVAAGLLWSGQPFGFMAMLGVLSLSGMLIKNAIVLIDEIGLRLQTRDRPAATLLLEASASRIRPVLMAALTTILGMLPLIADAFFAAMAVTIMAGLTFACAVTLFAVPLLYACFFRIRPNGKTIC